MQYSFYHNLPSIAKLFPAVRAYFYSKTLEILSESTKKEPAFVLTRQPGVIYIRPLPLSPSRKPAVRLSICVTSSREISVNSASVAAKVT